MHAFKMLETFKLFKTIARLSDGLNDLNGLNYLNRLRAAFFAFFVVKSLLGFGCGVAAHHLKVIDIALRNAIKEICRPRLGKLGSGA